MKKYIQIQVSNTFDYYRVNGDNTRTIIDEMFLTKTLVKYHTLDSLVKTNFCKDNMGPFPILYDCKLRNIASGVSTRWQDGIVTI